MIPASTCGRTAAHRRADVPELLELDSDRFRPGSAAGLPGTNSIVADAGTRPLTGVRDPPAGHELVAPAASCPRTMTFPGGAGRTRCAGRHLGRRCRPAGGAAACCAAHDHRAGPRAARDGARAGRHPDRQRGGALRPVRIRPGDRPRAARRAARRPVRPAVVDRSRCGEIRADGRSRSPAAVRPGGAEHGRAPGPHRGRSGGPVLGSEASATGASRRRWALHPEASSLPRQARWAGTGPNYVLPWTRCAPPPRSPRLAVAVPARPGPHRRSSTRSAGSETRYRPAAGRREACTLTIEGSRLAAHRRPGPGDRPARLPLRPPGGRGDRRRGLPVERRQAGCLTWPRTAGGRRGAHRRHLSSAAHPRPGGMLSSGAPRSPGWPPAARSPATPMRCAASGWPCPHPWPRGVRRGSDLPCWRGAAETATATPPASPHADRPDRPTDVIAPPSRRIRTARVAAGRRGPPSADRAHPPAPRLRRPAPRLRRRRLAGAGRNLAGAGRIPGRASAASTGGPPTDRRGRRSPNAPGGFGQRGTLTALIGDHPSGQVSPTAAMRARGGRPAGCG